MKTQRLLSFVFVLLLITSSLTAKTYKIAVLQDYYPYSKISEHGDAQGIIIDWWKEWSEVTGIDVEFYPMDLELINQQLISGDIDILGGLYYTEERTSYLEFGDPIMRTQSVLFLKDEVAFDSVQFVSVLKGSVAVEILSKQYPSLTLKDVTSISQLREEISFKQVDGYVFDIPVLLGNDKGIEAPESYSKYATLFTDKIRPAVKKGNDDVMNDIMLGVNQISTDKLFEIARKYELYEPNKSYLKWVFGIALISLITITILLLIVRKQKHKVKRLIDFENNTDWQVILDKGENDLIEFKSSLRWDYRQEKPNKALEIVIIKTLSAFLNTNGGMLFIGVDDEGKALGLEYDYKSFSKGNRDGFMLALTNLVNQHIGKNIHRFLSINIISINEKDVCIINIDKSAKPVFFGKGDKEEFYIRTSAASQPLGIRESYEYIKSHWE